MATYCECGDVATIFADIKGDPLPEPLCSDCFFFQTTMDYEHTMPDLAHQPIPNLHNSCNSWQKETRP